MKEPNRVRKNEIKYSITLNEEQKKAKQTILDNQITILTGDPGSGKTLLMSQIALDLLNKKQINQVVLIRPAVEVGKTLGLLPGLLSEKIDPYFEAFKECMKECGPSSMVGKYVDPNNSFLRMLPIQFVRGLTFRDDVLVCADELQNSTINEIMAVLSRIGKNSKIILSGDNAQQDTKEITTGLEFVLKMSKELNFIEHVELKENHRSEYIVQMWEYYKKHKNG